MDFIYNKQFLKHESKGQHPECPSRLSYFDKTVEETKLQPNESDLSLVHSKEYIDAIKKASQNEENIDADTYTSKESFKTSCDAVAAAILASEKNGFSLGRPPGHHANQHKAHGFCLFNNIAIATQKLVNEGKKVLIIDFDGHHGNGTQDIFYESDQVLFLSIHQFPAFPGSGWLEEIGKNKGEGYTINIPLPPYSGDDLFLSSLNKIIPKLKEQFKPDVVGISAGFDAHHADPLLNLELTTNAYHQLGTLIKNNFNNFFACLEGGYNLTHLHRCILDFMNGINGKPQQFEENKTTSDPDIVNEFNIRFELLKELHKSKWGL